MGKSNRMTESKFSAVKILLKGGASVKEAARFIQISEWTVYQIRKCETYEEYQNVIAARTLTNKQIAAMNAKKAEEVAKHVCAVTDSEMVEEKPQVVEHKQTVVVQATHYMMEELRKVNESLNLLNNKLGFIVDELTK